METTQDEGSLNLDFAPVKKKRFLSRQGEVQIAVGDRTFKLAFGTTSEYGRYVESLRGARDGCVRHERVASGGELAGMKRAQPLAWGASVCALAK